MHIDIRSFLTSGTFGGLLLPATRGRIRAALGEPEQWGMQREVERADIWKYGSIEFHFQPDSDDLFMIFSDHLSPFTSGSHLTLDPWIIDGTLTLDDAEKALSNDGIACERVRREAWEAVELVTPGGVSLQFDRADGVRIEYRLIGWWKIFSPRVYRVG